MTGLPLVSIHQLKARLSPPASSPPESATASASWVSGGRSRCQAQAFGGRIKRQRLVADEGICTSSYPPSTRVTQKGAAKYSIVFCPSWGDRHRRCHCGCCQSNSFAQFHDRHETPLFASSHSARPCSTTSAQTLHPGVVRHQVLPAFTGVAGVQQAKQPHRPRLSPSAASGAPRPDHSPNTPDARPASDPDPDWLPFR
jgi:hypothetical protein